MEDEQAEFRFLRTVNIRTFYIGSAAADLLVTSVWNRIKIVDLGMAACRSASCNLCWSSVLRFCR